MLSCIVRLSIIVILSCIARLSIIVMLSCITSCLLLLNCLVLLRCLMLLVYLVLFKRYADFRSVITRPLGLHCNHYVSLSVRPSVVS